MFSPFLMIYSENVTNMQWCDSYLYTGNLWNITHYICKAACGATAPVWRQEFILSSDDQWVTDIFIIHLRKYVCWQDCAEFRIVYCVFLAGGISARLKITKDWWGLMRFACLMPQGSGGQLTSRQLENLSQQPWRSFCSSIANNQMIWGGRCPVSIKYNKELIKWFWFVWCAVMGVGWMVESGTVSLAFKWQLLEFLIFGV